MPSSSSFGAVSAFKPRFLQDAKAREPYKNTNLGNAKVLFDDQVSTMTKGSTMTRNTSSKYNSMRINPTKAIELYGDAKEQLNRMIDGVGRKVCGYTVSPAAIPSDYLHE